MSLAVYYPTDIINALLAAEQSAKETARATGDSDDPFAVGYMRGHRSALTTIALAFGLTDHDDDQGGLPRLANAPTWEPLTLGRGQ